MATSSYLGWGSDGGAGIHVLGISMGGQGVGKSFFVERFGEFFGEHFVPVTDPKHVVGNFNVILQNALLVFSDEAFAADNNRTKGILKGLITQSHVTIEPKGVDPFKTQKYFRIIFASNHSWVVPADIDDRRYAAFDVPDTKARDFDYFSSIKKEWDAGGREAFMCELTNRDISNFNHRDRPETSALIEQKIHSFHGSRLAVYEMLMSGEAPILEEDKEEYFIPTSSMITLNSNRRISKQAMGKELLLASHQKTKRYFLIQSIYLLPRLGPWVRIPSLAPLNQVFTRHLFEGVFYFETVLALSPKKGTKRTGIISLFHTLPSLSFSMSSNS